ncbi:MAG: enoyl-CoA hydratase/isomerase family protein [Chloroflexi bacterium]|nr:enoyl-CoA hydratase/isomerase family protein [Chloroflexota bacterium]
MEYKTILIEKSGNVGRIIFNRPDKMNTFDFPGQGGMADDFRAALDDMAADDEIKVVIIKGAGRCFSAGHDLTSVGFVYGMGTGKDGRRASQRTRLKVDKAWFYDNYMRLLLCPKITIAQVHGYCIGDGIATVSCCDLAIAAEDASIGHSEQRLGFAGSGGPDFGITVATIGLKRAVEIHLTGRIFDGREAERMGLVNRAVPAGSLESETEELARTIALMPRDGIAIGKAHRHLTYEALGLTGSVSVGYLSHTLFTNLRWEPDEYNFFKHRRDKGAREGFHGVHGRYRDGGETETTNESSMLASEHHEV